MKAMTRIGTKCAAIELFLAVAAAPGPAAAQHYEGCFVGGQQVQDSQCGGGGGNAGMGGNAGVNAAGSLGFAIGAGLGAAIRNLVIQQNANSASSAALNNRGVELAAEGRRAEAADLFSQAVSMDLSNDVALGNYLVTEAQLEYAAGRFDRARELAIQALRYDAGPVAVAREDLAVYEKAIATQKQTSAAQAQREFDASQQELLSQIRPLGTAAADEPHPIYRDGDTPRDYPELASYDADQRAAHETNEIGTLQAKTGDWAGALLTFRAALTRDNLNSPFRRVIEENIAIAERHLAPAKAAPATNVTAAQPTTRPTPPIREVRAPLCDQWSSQGPGIFVRVCAEERNGAHFCQQLTSSGYSRVAC